MNFYKKVRDAREVFQQRHEGLCLVREHRNTENGHTAAGTRVEVGDLMLVEYADAVQARKGCIPN